MTSKCGVPSSWRRQLGGTLKVQVEHLAVDVALSVAAAAVPGGGFWGKDRLVLVVLREAKAPLRPCEIGNRTRACKSTVNESLNRLESRGLVRRKEVPNQLKTPAWAWFAVAA